MIIGKELPKMYADLHIHTRFSDGSSTPEDIVDIAARNGTKVIAICDHDTVAGLPRAAISAKKNGISLIEGIEFSTTTDGIPIHILGYNCDRKAPKFRNFLTELNEDRTATTKRIFDKLVKTGKLKYSWEDVLRHNKDAGYIYSVHVFYAMMADGFYTNNSEWNEFHYSMFAPGCPAYESTQAANARAAIEVVNSCKGLSVLAHPILMQRDDKLDELVSWGLQGIEVYYPSCRAADICRYLEFAEKKSLVVTGGTDFHGDFTKWDVTVGSVGLTKGQVMSLNI